MPYLGKQSEQVGVSVQKYEFLQGTDSSSGATSFSIPSDSGDHVNVWLNGILLVEGAAKDYTTTNSTVDFVTAPADDDIVRIDVVESFALPDALKSSGDAMSGTLKLNGGIQQQTSADLSGTYAYHQLMLSDAFTVAGDVTISDNLVLAKLSDDSNAITISNDTSTRTITGTGSLEASTLAQTPNASLTGMTGTIGSAVTFPAGHVIQTRKVIIPTGDGGSDYYSQTLDGTPTLLNLNGAYQITGFTATDGNTLILTTGGFWENTATGPHETSEIVFYKDSTTIGSTNLYSDGSHRHPIHFSVVRDNISGYSNVTISIKVSRNTSSAGTIVFGNSGEYTNTEEMFGFILIQEIQA